jgi:hypothetical protein
MAPRRILQRVFISSPIASAFDVSGLDVLGPVEFKRFNLHILLADEKPESATHGGLATPMNTRVPAGRMTMRVWVFVAILLLLAARVICAEPGPAMRVTRTIAAPEALQAAAADERFVYAVDSRVIAKYDRATGERMAASTGEATHLNSAFLWEGKLYCAHSNYPRKPEHSEIKVLEPDTMKLTTFKDFGASPGSLTWVVREGEFWWCTFAYYGTENAKTRLVKFDAAWRELDAWVYPPDVVKQLGNYSISGGLWHQGKLLATGHDRRAIYQFQLPKTGEVLDWSGTIQSPFPGQGIASDGSASGLVGIDRGRKQVIFASLPE